MMNMIDSSFFNQVRMMLHGVPAFIETVTKDQVYQDLIKSKEQFDVMILFSMITEPLVGLAEHLNASVIEFSPIGGNVYINYHENHPGNPSYVPHMILSYTDTMTFKERLVNTLTSTFTDLFHHFLLMPFFEKLSRETFNNTRPLREMIEDVDLYLINSNAATETPRPYMPNMIQIGGFHLEEEQTLPEDVRSYLDSSEHGVIYFSMGSNVNFSSFEDHQQEAILKSLGKQKLNVLFKCEKNIENLPPNIKVGKWFPQKAVLGIYQTNLT